MADDSEFKFKSIVVEILPDTKRTRMLKQQKKEEQERLEQEKRQRMEQAKEKQDKIRELKEKAKKQALEDEERKRQEELEREEELRTIKTLKGKFGLMINALKNQDTELEYTISGLELRDKQITILASVINKNQTLRALVMPRKNIPDDIGQKITKNLQFNNCLERFEMEGNKLGIQTCLGLAKLLTSNQSIRHLDLEGNGLIIPDNDKDKEIIGIKSLAESLEKNDTLLYLNLSNCGLTKKCGEVLLNMIKQNKTIISLLLDSNKDLDPQDLRNIDQCLMNNKQDYDDRRLREFHERRKMWKEHDISLQLATIREAEKIRKEIIETRIANKRLEKEQEFDQKMIEMELEKKKMIAKLAKEASKKTKKKRRK